LSINSVDLSEVGDLTSQSKTSKMNAPTGTTLNEHKGSEYPNYDDELQLDTSEMAILDLLILCAMTPLVLVVAFTMSC
jgi:hypothetical protein